MADRILVAMSGGVDSAVAALLLQRQGHHVAGATMKLFDNALLAMEVQSTCCSLDDVVDARTAASRMGIAHHVFGFGAPFRRQVIDRFGAEYAAGRTPNPCIDCNRFVKFPLLLRRARELGFHGVATGHYARVARDAASGRWLLKRARDTAKDQSYVLYAMTQEQLAATRFPLGNLCKPQVRALAEQAGFSVADKPDSQDICFVPDGDYAQFLTRRLGVAAVPGPVVDVGGNVIGEHRGILAYTVGQRRHLPVRSDRRLYVVDKDAATATLTLGSGDELLRGGLLAEDANWISIDALREPLPVTVKTRYRQVEKPAVLHPAGEGAVEVRYLEPQPAAAPGQAAVFYDGDTVVGGATITRALP